MTRQGPIVRAKSKKINGLALIVNRVVNQRDQGNKDG